MPSIKISLQNTVISGSCTRVDMQMLLVLVSNHTVSSIIKCIRKDNATTGIACAILEEKVRISKETAKLFVKGADTDFFE